MNISAGPDERLIRGRGHSLAQRERERAQEKRQDERGRGGVMTHMERQRRGG